MGLIERLVKKTVVNWLAKQLEVTPSFLNAIVDDIIEFVKQILEGLSQEEQLKFFEQGAKALRTARPERVKQILKNLQETY